MPAQREAYVSPIDRIPPNSLEAEMALLGSVLVDREMFEAAAAIVLPTDFYASLHETVWQAMVSLNERSAPIDKVSLAEELRRRGVLDKVGGLAYLTTLMDTVPTAASVEYYARLVREKAALRGLIKAGMKIAELGYTGEDDARAAEAEAERIMSIAVRGEITRENPFDAATGTIAGALVDEYLSGKKPDRGVLSPWPEINDLVGGFKPGELIGWIGAPKIAKSAVVLTLGDYIASHHGTVALFANENGQRRTVERHLALRGGVPARRQRNFDFRDGETSKLLTAHRSMASLPMFIYGREHRSLKTMYRALRALRKQGPIASIILDHVGKLEDVERESGRTTKHERLDRAYGSLIDMAYEFECPVHFVQHLNRKEGEGEPTTASFKNIRDGGNVEGHVDMAIFVHRDKPSGTQIEREMGVLIVALTRDGEPGRVPMQYIGHRNLWLQADANGRTWFETPRASSQPVGMDFSTLGSTEADLGDSPFGA